MKFVCACTGDEDVGDYSYAVIDMPDAYVEWLWQRLRVSKQVAAEEEDFYAAAYYDHQVNYYDSFDVDFDIEDGQFHVVPDSFEPTREPQRVAATTVVITRNSVVWMGHPKHGSGKFETATMPAEFLSTLRDTEPASII